MTGKRADLNPPLGKNGGPCKVVDRIRQNVRNLRDQQTLVGLVERGEDLTNPQATVVYPAIQEVGPAPFRNITLRSHAQYRMDQRGITVPELKESLVEFRDLVKGVMDRYQKARGQVRALSHQDREVLERLQNNPKFDWQDKNRTLVLGPEPNQNRLDVITVWDKSGNIPVPAGGCPQKTAGYRAPAGELSGYRTFPGEKPTKGIDSPSSGDSVHHSPGESPRADRERALPKRPTTREDAIQKTPANTVYNTPSGSDVNEGQKIHVRTPGKPGEEYGHPYKENVYPRRTDDAQPASRSAAVGAGLSVARVVRRYLGGPHG